MVVATSFPLRYRSVGSPLLRILVPMTDDRLIAAHLTAALIAQAQDANLKAGLWVTLPNCILTSSTS
jgi:hypothetical protein